MVKTYNPGYTFQVQTGCMVLDQKDRAIRLVFPAAQGDLGFVLLALSWVEDFALHFVGFAEIIEKNWMACGYYHRLACGCQMETESLHAEVHSDMDYSGQETAVDFVAVVVVVAVAVEIVAVVEIAVAVVAASVVAASVVAASGTVVAVGIAHIGIAAVVEIVPGRGVVIAAASAAVAAAAAHTANAAAAAAAVVNDQLHWASYHMPLLVELVRYSSGVRPPP
jgi:hypothetical protein